MHGAIASAVRQCRLLPALVTMGCAITGPDLPPAPDFPWLRKGVARAEVVAHLGTPAHRFDDDRILCFLLYGFGEDGNAYHSIAHSSNPWLESGAPWRRAKVQVNIVFDPEGRVSKFRTRRMRE